MKTAIIILTILAGSSMVLLLLLGRYSQKGQAPGLVNGRLSRCSDKPNCAGSEHPDDLAHYIEPLASRQNLVIDDMPKAVSTIKDMGGFINNATDNYVAASFKSSIFGFVDDLEIRIDTTDGVMHFRSASRVGYSDMGVNRNRIELFKKLYTSKQNNRSVK